MRFSWKALFLSPLPVCLIGGFLLVGGSTSRYISGFFLFAGLVGLVAYSIECFMFVPALFLVSRLTKITSPIVVLVGIIVSIFSYLPITWMLYTSSGPDSGPPVISYFQFIKDTQATDIGAVVVGGIISSITYALLTRTKRIPR